MGMITFRTRATRKSWTVETREVQVFAQADPRWPPLRLGPSLIVAVKVAMAGGGKSMIATTIPPSEFANLARLMVQLDPDAARMAFDAAVRQKVMP